MSARGARLFSNHVSGEMDVGGSRELLVRVAELAREGNFPREDAGWRYEVTLGEQSVSEQYRASTTRHVLRLRGTPRPTGDRSMPDYMSAIELTVDEQGRLGYALDATRAAKAELGVVAGAFTALLALLGGIVFVVTRGEGVAWGWTALVTLAALLAIAAPLPFLHLKDVRAAERKLRQALRDEADRLAREQESAARVRVAEDAAADGEADVASARAPRAAG